MKLLAEDSEARNAVLIHTVENADGSISVAAYLPKVRHSISLLFINPNGTIERCNTNASELKCMGFGVGEDGKVKLQEPDVPSSE